MRLLEHEGKRLLADFSIPVPEGELVSDSGMEPAGIRFPVAVKAQVPTGGRMKAGAIRFAADSAELHRHVTDLLQAEVRGYRVESVLVEPKAEIAQEFYLGITYDSAAKAPVAIFSRSGGIDVEQAESVVRSLYPLIFDPAPFRFKELLAEAGVSGRLLGSLSTVFARLARLYRERDCLLAEINPLAVTGEGRLVAVDVHVELDDDALYRHPDLVKRWSLDSRDTDARAKSEFERRAEEIDSKDHRGVAGRMVEFPGSLGLLIGGGGASLTAFDAVRRHGGNPANYCEIGGNPSVWKVKELTKLLMQKEGVERIAVIMNVVSNTRVDLVARGVIKGILELGMDPAEKIAIFRIPGAWEEDGFAILRKYGVRYADRTVSIDEAARMAIEAAGGLGASAGGAA
ncbi:MAG: ADP-forming succinate--CoA ligase subunit beta [Thermoleophilia bacterium]